MPSANITITEPPQEAIDARLAQWGLVRDSSSAIPMTKNRTVLCRLGPTQRVFVKISDASSRKGLIREANVLRLLYPLVRQTSFPFRVPQLFFADTELGLVAVEWFESSETLHTYYHRTRKCTAVLARHIGRCIGAVHRSSRESFREAAAAGQLREEFDLIECFVRMRPDFYARLSAAGLDFMAEIQANVSALDALSELLAAEPRTLCLVHGDLRQANILRTTGRSRHSISLIDWEYAAWADPAKDLGTIIADYALGWLAPGDDVKTTTQTKLQIQTRTLLEAYQREREDSFRLDNAFEQRIARWVGAALLFYVYGITHYDGQFGPRVRKLTQHSIQMLASPARWAHWLLGTV